MDYDRLEYLLNVLAEVIEAFDDLGLEGLAQQTDMIHNEVSDLLEAKDEKEDEEWKEAA